MAKGLTLTTQSGDEVLVSDMTEEQLLVEMPLLNAMIQGALRGGGPSGDMAGEAFDRAFQEALEVYSAMELQLERFGY